MCVRGLSVNVCTEEGSMLQMTQVVSQRYSLSPSHSPSLQVALTAVCPVRNHLCLACAYKHTGIPVAGGGSVVGAGKFDLVSVSQS